MAFIVSSEDGETIFGTEEEDLLVAAHNDVTLIGGSGNDELFSLFGTNNTTMDGGAGNDILFGDGNNDTASYASAPAGVTVDLSAFEASDDGYGGRDDLVLIENVTGSAFDDSLTGDPFANVLEGGAGNDTLTGNGGADVFKYSFDFTAGGGETFSFTQFFADHGGTVVNGEVADGTKQGQFSSLYTQWLESLGLTVLDLGQNSGPGGMPVVEGPDGTFGERESFTSTSGSGKKAVTHERWYSDTWSAGGGEDTVTSNDGLDTILDFSMGDMLNFSGITKEQFLAHFNADSSGSAAGDASLNDTVLTINGVSNWSLTLADVSLNLTQVADQTTFS